MECFFINMDAQPERRDFLQRNFAQYKAPGWFLSRIQAADPAYIRSHGVAGAIRDGEKGCFVSHQLALREALDAPGHAFILEDDAMFGPNACAAIEGTLAQLEPGSWDLLFTDTSIYYAPLMLSLLQQRRELREAGAQTLIDMNEIAFCGSTAYVVNESAKEKLLGLITPPSLDEPYDVFLRRLIRESKLRALLTLPFATTVSDFADSSTIQDEHSDAERVLLNAFRRLAWADRDLGQIHAALARRSAAQIDAESDSIARLIGGYIALGAPK
jgi:GR25 family glycosyltransferase involved in LPS biosynthesis